MKHTIMFYSVFVLMVSSYVTCYEDAEIDRDACIKFCQSYKKNSSIPNCVRRCQEEFKQKMKKCVDGDHYP